MFKFLNGLGEDGSTIVLALVIMVIMSIVGFYMVNDSVTESDVTRNYITYKKNFYRAEGSVRYAVQRMDSQPDPKVLDPFESEYDSNLVQVQKSLDTDNIDWNDNNIALSLDDQDIQFDSQSNEKGTNYKYIIVYEGTSKGSNMDVTEQTRLRSFAIYGRGTSEGNDSGEFILDVGYRRRF